MKILFLELFIQLLKEVKQKILSLKKSYPKYIKDKVQY